LLFIILFEVNQCFVSQTLGGHIMAASTSSDLNTQFLASRSRVTVVTPGELNTGIAL